LQLISSKLFSNQLSKNIVDLFLLYFKQNFMISANQRTFLTSLHLKKYRQKYRNFLVEGEKMVGELINSISSGSANGFSLVVLYGTKQWAIENQRLLDPFYSIFNEVEEEDLKKVGTLTTPNGVLAVVAHPKTEVNAETQQGLNLYLDGLQDPGNLGTILRIADWFGIKTVYCSRDTVDAFSPKVIQSGMGACFRVRVKEDCALGALLAANPTWAVMGAVMDGKNVFTEKLPSSGILVIGNEGKGIRPEQLQQLTHRLTIPAGAGGGAESLNAAVATGILVATLLNKNKA
jgi:TrmH family RNA methyltransferase